MAVIRTVLGDIDPADLGVCAMHEHLLARPPAPYDEEEPDLILDDETASQQELAYFHQAGGRAMVEMTPIDYHRQPLGLKRLSEATGVHLICITGFLKDKFSAAFVKDETVESLAARFVKDVEQSIDDTGVRAGVIKAASSLNTITANEEKVFRAAARAHLETGALISTHTEGGTMGLEQVEILRAEGVPANRILIGHLDRKLDWDYHLAMAQKGVYLGFDQASKEKYYPDAKRIEFIQRLIEAGYSKQIMLSSDLARKSSFPSYGVGGGPGFTYLQWRFVPWLWASGVAEATIHEMRAENPARALTLHKG